MADLSPRARPACSKAPHILARQRPVWRTGVRLLALLALGLLALRATSSLWHARARYLVAIHSLGNPARAELVEGELRRLYEFRARATIEGSFRDRNSAGAFWLAHGDWFAAPSEKRWQVVGPRLDDRGTIWSCGFLEDVRDWDGDGQLEALVNCGSLGLEPNATYVAVRLVCDGGPRRQELLWAAVLPAAAYVQREQRGPQLRGILRVRPGWHESADGGVFTFDRPGGVLRADGPVAEWVQPWYAPESRPLPIPAGTQLDEFVRGLFGAGPPS